jgi:hypothetical protein
MSESDQPRRTAREALAAASWIELLTVALGVVGFFLALLTTYREFFPAPGTLTMSLVDFRALDLSGPSSFRIESQLVFVNDSTHDFVIRDVSLFSVDTPVSNSSTFFNVPTTTGSENLPMSVPAHRTKILTLTSESGGPSDRRMKRADDSGTAALEFEILVVLPSAETRLLRITGIEIARDRMSLRTAPVTITDGG